MLAGCVQIFLAAYATALQESLWVQVAASNTAMTYLHNSARHVYW